MKKLMFVAAVAASCVAVADDVASGFDADDGIYSVTITEKTLGLEYVQESCVYPEQDPEEDPVWEGNFETKAKAKAAAQLTFDEDINSEGDCTLKSIATKKDSDTKEWGYQIKYTKSTGEAKSAKVVNGTVNGMLVKGDILPGCEDGALFLWFKDKNNRCEDTGLYYAYSMTGEEAEVVGSPVANKAVGGIKLTVYDGDLEAYAAGIGTSAKDADGDYVFVKTLSGNAATTTDSGIKAYGTWKITMDANATKLAKKGRYTLAQLLAKKGAVEVR